MGRYADEAEAAALEEYHALMEAEDNVRFSEFDELEFELEIDQEQKRSTKMK